MNGVFFRQMPQMLKQHHSLSFLISFPLEYGPSAGVVGGFFDLLFI